MVKAKSPMFSIVTSTRMLALSIVVVIDRLKSKFSVIPNESSNCSSVTSLDPLVNVEVCPRVNESFCEIFALIDSPGGKNCSEADSSLFRSVTVDVVSSSLVSKVWVSACVSCERIMLVSVMVVPSSSVCEKRRSSSRLTFPIRIRGFGISAMRGLRLN